MKEDKDNNKYVIGLDFGADSIRSLIVNVESGKEEATCLKL